MPTYATPGVYYERVDAGAPTISAIRTDVAGFVGIAQRGPIDTAVPIQSWRQFQAHFGDFTGSAYLAYTVRGFFENGGRRCWIVRVASRDALGGAGASSVTFRNSANQPVWQVAASSTGTWGDSLSITLRETHQAQTLTVPGAPIPNASVVGSLTGFARHTQVRLTQGTRVTQTILSGIDPMASTLLWGSDQPLLGFDSNTAILIESIEYTLIVRQNEVPLAVYDGLSLVPQSANYGPNRLPPFSVPDDVLTRGTLPPSPLPITIEDLRDPALIDGKDALVSDPNADLPLTGGADGLRLLQAFDFMGEDFSPWDDDTTRARKRRGLRVLREIEEVSTVAVPDILIQPAAPALHRPLPPCVSDPCVWPVLPAVTVRPKPEIELPPVFSERDIFQVQSAMVQMCEELGDRVALIDPPIDHARDWRSRFDSKYAAFYYPWLCVVDPLRTQTSALTRQIPPSGHVAGQYARTDFTVGVHKAPANALLDWVQDVTVPIDDALHGVLNLLGINVIRQVNGRGLRIYGARTVSSDPDWKYVNVRRLLMMIEKAIDISTQWAAFEPNDTVTRAKLNLSLTSFLLALWQQGALMGASANAAFFVKCDDGNNTPEDRANGRLLAEVGVAPSQPFEFVVLRVGRVNNEFEISEGR